MGKGGYVLESVTPLLNANKEAREKNKSPGQNQCTFPPPDSWKMSVQGIISLGTQLSLCRHWGVGGVASGKGGVFESLRERIILPPSNFSRNREVAVLRSDHRVRIRSNIPHPITHTHVGRTSFDCWKFDPDLQLCRRMN